MIEITMPRLSDTMEEGSIATWHKKPGDPVEVGDVLVEIETDKATMEYEAYEAGTMSKILVPEGELATIGQPIALLDDGSGAAPAGDESPQSVAATTDAAPGGEPGVPVSDEQAQDAAGTASAGRAASAGERIETEEPGLDTAAEPVEGRPAEQTDERRFASPLVRKLARDHGLDLSSVHGTGPGGRIIRADIEGLLSGAGGTGGTGGEPSVAAGAPTSGSAGSRATGATPATGAADAKRASESVPLSQTRRVIARRLGESARTIPHFYVTAVADAEALMTLRADLNAQLTASGRPKVSVNDLLIRASALALREHPLVNASYLGDESTTMQVHHRINVGIAVASENGLVVPVIEDADEKTVTQLGVEAKKLVGLANDKKLSIDQMSGGTFTISNLGMFGVEQFTAIINPPEGAILAVGGTKPEPVVIDGEVVVHHRMRYTLSADHRIIDGALAAQFLQTLTRLIESPWTIIA
jgi:pyruvate dehydrogenase E2 component (dihydrolipoamide acetyltransferase)